MLPHRGFLTLPKYVGGLIPIFEPKSECRHIGGFWTRPEVTYDVGHQTHDANPRNKERAYGGRGSGTPFFIFQVCVQGSAMTWDQGAQGSPSLFYSILVPAKAAIVGCVVVWEDCLKKVAVSPFLTLNE